MGRYQNAIEQLRFAEEADPLSIVNLGNEVIYFTIFGKEEEAARKIAKMLELDPGNPMVQDLHVTYYYLKKDYQRSIGLGLKYIERERNPNFLADLAFAYAASGDEAEAMKWIEELQALPAGIAGRSISLAWAYSAVGKLDEFFQWAHQALEDKTMDFGDLRLFVEGLPSKEVIRKDPRYVELFRRVGLKP